MASGTMKLLSSKDDKATANHLKTQSGLELINLSTGKPVTDGAYITKQWLFDEIAKGNLKGNLKEPDGEIYDHLVIELGTNATYAEEASKIILNRLQNPNLSLVKNQGNGRIQEKHITGTKEVLAGLHKEANGEYHLHALVCRYSIDGDNVNPQDSQKDKYVRAKYLEKINEDLTTAGLAPLRDFTTSITSPNASLPKASITTQNEVKQVLSGELDIEDITLENASITETVLDDSIIKAEKALAQTIEQAKKQTEELNQLKAAQSILDENRILSRNNATLKQANTELEESNNSLKSSNEELEKDVAQKETQMFEQGNQIATLLEQIAEKQALLDEAEAMQAQSNEDLEQKQTVIDSLSGEISVLQDSVKALTAEKVSIESALDIREKQLEQANNSVNALQETVKSKDEQIDLQKQLNKQLQEKFEAQLEEQRKQFEARFAEQSKEIEAVKVKLDEKTKENSVLKDFIKVVSDKLDEATTVIQSLSKKLKTVAEKNFITKYIQETKEFNKASEALDKEIADKEKRIQEMRDRMVNRRPEVDSFTQAGTVEKKPENKDLPKKK